MGNKVQGTLLIVGGAEDKKGKCEILSKFVELSGGKNSIILVITTATEDSARAGQEYARIFKGLKAGQIEVLDLDSRQKANQPYIEKLLEKSTGIFFTGGDQLRITAMLGGTIANQGLRQAYLQGTVIAGTSAGASVMTNTMIAEGDSEEAPKLNTIKLAPGLGLLEDVVVDQHFAQRGRIGRLLSAIAYNPYILGMGIDEDTAVVVYPDATLEVIGSQTVTFIDGRQITYSNVSELSPDQALAIEKVIIHVLPKGYRFDLTIRKPSQGETRKGDTNENR
ncbi:MAG: cyanophycinase [Thermincola sp.]|jgi:cyanophycinase|nr:cyanophycinase [Thermincola sp.]MDT3702098.1 cyanophycinase [Thermincola sp.]